jgi:hypothetical protein
MTPKSGVVRECLYISSRIVEHHRSEQSDPLDVNAQDIRYLQIVQHTHGKGTVHLRPTPNGQYDTVFGVSPLGSPVVEMGARAPLKKQGPQGRGIRSEQTWKMPRVRTQDQMETIGMGDRRRSIRREDLWAPLRVDALTAQQRAECRHETPKMLNPRAGCQMPPRRPTHR